MSWFRSVGLSQGCLELRIDLSISQAVGASFACEVDDRLRQGGARLCGVWGSFSVVASSQRSHGFRICTPVDLKSARLRVITVMP
jgi:hypothetical protein